MNQRGPGLLDAVGLAAIKSRLASVVQDSDTGTSVTVSTTTGAPTADYAAGTSTPNTDDDTVTGLLLALTLKEVTNSGGAYQLGDRRLRVMVDDLSSPPTVDSTVTVGADVFDVIQAETDALGLQYVLILRLSV